MYVIGAGRIHNQKYVLVFRMGKGFVLVFRMGKGFVIEERLDAAQEYAK